MVSVRNLAYAHPNKDILFEGIHLNLQAGEKAALAGNNGSGKSTLLRVMAGLLSPTAGAVQSDATPYYVPQHYGQYDDCTVAEAIGVAGKIEALQAILAGAVTEAALEALDDDWSIEERCAAALAAWGLDGLSLSRKLGTLSGGQKTQVFLAGIAVHEPAVVLLDEPSNHLDVAGRARLYDLVQRMPAAALVVSHDRSLLRLLATVYELSPDGLALYGGGYDGYREQKAAEAALRQEAVRGAEKALRKARDGARESAERQQKLDARGRKKQEQAGLPTISMNTLRNNAERSTARLKGVHEEKTAALSEDLAARREALPEADRIRIGFGSTAQPAGKELVVAQGVNSCRDGVWLWPAPLSTTLYSGERIAVSGPNGAGKTTLVKLLLGQEQPAAGRVQSRVRNAVVIDQEYTRIDPALSVWEMARRCNTDPLPEPEVKSRLTHFLFGPEAWDRPCAALSGGEKMRLLLCCLTLRSEAPDLMVLDEPTNNLDIQNVEILTVAVRAYAGTLLVISHDTTFLDALSIGREIVLAPPSGQTGPVPG